MAIRKNTRTATISLSKDVSKLVDRICKVEKRKRSNLIELALESFLEENYKDFDNKDKMEK